MKPEEMNELKELVEFLRSYNVAEFELDRGDVKVRLKFATQEAARPSLADLAHAAVALPVAPAAAPLPIVPAAPPVAVPEANLHTVKSEIVGTFYGSPSPGAAPFVAPGDRVQKGQVVCIVEAMKLMNEIESDAAGEVVKCFVTNGQPIEFGQPLFSVRPS